MSTSTSALPSEAIQPLYFPGPPRSTYAKETLKLTGDSKRANRLDKCGRFTNKRDENGHTKRQIQTCSSSFCIGCSLCRSHNHLDRWEPTLQSIANFTSPINVATYIEAIIPQYERSRESVEQFASDMRDMLAPFGPHFLAIPGYTKNNLILRMLVINTHIDFKSWTAMFPANARVKIIETSLVFSELSRLFRMLVDVIFIKDLSSTDRAQQEVLFSGMRRLRAYGIKQEKELFAKSVGKDFANNSSDGIASTPPHDNNLCSTCGKPYIEQSQWFDAGSPEPREEDYRWYPIKRREH